VVVSGIATPDGEVRLERSGPVAVVVLDRPERRNALGAAMWRELDRVVGELERALPRVVVLTGTGDRAFCAGMDVHPDNPDVASLMTAVQERDRRPVVAMLSELRRVADRLFALPVPIIAAINGSAFGGGAELAVRCDLRVMDASATLAFSEVRLGLMPDWGGGVALTRLVGPARAADLILTARRVDAEEALALGIVSRVCAPGTAVETTKELADAIAANGPLAVRSALRVIRRAPDLSEPEALALELETAASLIASGECVFGIGAFFSRTPPSFPDPDDETGSRV
jgi:enoyl-CoA hydratase/carnithine racemase